MTEKATQGGQEWFAGIMWGRMPEEAKEEIRESRGESTEEQ